MTYKLETGKQAQHNAESTTNHQVIKLHRYIKSLKLYKTSVYLILVTYINKHGTETVVIHT